MEENVGEDVTLQPRRPGFNRHAGKQAVLSQRILCILIPLGTDKMVVVI